MLAATTLHKLVNGTKQTGLILPFYKQAFITKQELPVTDSSCIF